MKNLENLGQELQRSGRAEDIRRLADSEDGKKLGQMFDAEKLSKAAESGDSAAMKKIVQDVLQSEEGRRIAESLLKLMGG